MLFTKVLLLITVLVKSGCTNQCNRTRKTKCKILLGKQYNNIGGHSFELSFKIIKILRFMCVCIYIYIYIYICIYIYIYIYCIYIYIYILDTLDICIIYYIICLYIYILYIHHRLSLFS